MKLFNKSKGEKSNFVTVSEGLKQLYSKKLKPLEEIYKFHELQAPCLEASDFDSAPMIMMLGQYSTGKTSLIRYLLSADYKGMQIGAEPTTDGFVVIMHGDSERIIPGNALAVDSKRPFRSLSSFGNNFLNKFCCSEMNHQLLENITIVDTPGILAGDKQTVARGYDFIGVVKWFAERVDRILLLFDSHKLDISDEFKQTIEVLKPYESKIRIILNKADAYIFA